MLTGFFNEIVVLAGVAVVVGWKLLGPGKTLNGLPKRTGASRFEAQTVLTEGTYTYES